LYNIIHGSYPKYKEELQYLEDLSSLYHYTNIGGVLGILNTGSIWLTNVKTANDFSEGRIILEKSFSEGKTRKELVKLLLNNLYTCSFTTNGNMLSQWRSYGDVAIGFDYSSIQNSQRLLRDASNNDYDLDTSGTQFGLCEYVDIGNDNELRAYISAVNKYENLFKNDKFQDKQRALLSIGSICFNLKHVGFYEEKEARVFSYLWNKSPKYNGKTKYIEYKIESQNVKEIIIGPSKHKDENLKIVQDFISNHVEYSHIKILESGIPFKGIKKYGSYKYY